MYGSYLQSGGERQGTLNRLWDDHLLTMTRKRIESRNIFPQIIIPAVKYKVTSSGLSGVQGEAEVMTPRFVAERNDLDLRSNHGPGRLIKMPTDPQRACVCAMTQAV